jgi:hypothetical protein
MGLARQVSEYPKQNDRVTTSIVAAGDAVDSTINYYVDMRDFSGCASQLEFTAGAGGGTINVTVLATTYEAQDENGASGLAYQDVSSAVLGAASKSATYIASDSSGVAGQYTWLKWVITVANKDASTAYNFRVNKTRSGS